MGQQRSSFGNDETRTLVENSYDSPEPKMIPLNENQTLLVYLDDDGSRSDLERTALKYAVCNNRTGDWSNPEILQDDATADFEPALCDMGDKILIAWSSHNDQLDASSETYQTDYLKSQEIYAAFLDKQTLAVTGITQLTDDTYYDCSPSVTYDEESGTAIVYYLKSEVGDDFVTSASATTNGSVLTYRTYDTKNGSWSESYLPEELSSVADTEAFTNQWYGQRFVAAATETYQNPAIIDFTAASYKGYGIYAYTVDQDNNLDTEDRELYIQCYDFRNGRLTQAQKVYESDTAAAKSRPQIVTAGDECCLFWCENGRDIRYVNLGAYLTAVREGSAPDEFENHPSYVAAGSSEDQRPVFDSYQALVDENGNIFITYPETVQETDEENNTIKTSVELFATAMIHSEEETSETDDSASGTSWSEGVQITHSGMYNDTPALAGLAGSRLLIVNNQYSMDLSSDHYSVSDTSLVATILEPVPSLEVTSMSVDLEDIEESRTIPKAGDYVIVDFMVKNNGLMNADGYSYGIETLYDGQTVEDAMVTWGADSAVIPPSSTASGFAVVEIPESAVDMQKVTYRISVQENGFAEEKAFDFQPLKDTYAYKLDNAEAYQAENGFRFRCDISNTGITATPASGDRLTVRYFNEYRQENESETFLTEELTEIQPDETKSLDLELSIPDSYMDNGYTTAEYVIEDSDGNVKLESDPISITMEKPYGIAVNGDMDNDVITLKEGDTLALSGSYKSDVYFGGGSVEFSVDDTMVAELDNGTLTAQEAGTTTLHAFVLPYGGNREITLKVEPKTVNPDQPGTGPDNPDNPGSNPSDPDNPGINPTNPVNPDDNGNHSSGNNSGNHSGNSSGSSNSGNSKNDKTGIHSSGKTKTGDDTNLIFWIVLLAVSGGAAAGFAVKRKKNNNKKQ